MMTDLIGFFYFGETYAGSSINYGRRFLVEPPDVIWRKYENARGSGAPQITLNYLLNQFYQSEFANDIESLTMAVVGMKLEPFIHSTDAQIDKLPIAAEDKTKKYYFNEWFVSIPPLELLTKDISELIKEFAEFMSNQNIQNAGQEVQ